jgi:peptidoglycan/LPS O-acetylase OafA/YrhL
MLADKEPYVAKAAGQSKRLWLPALQGLRGIAAISVVVFHVGFIPQPRPLRPDFLEPFLFALGNGVYLFFLLSSFSLAYSNSSRLHSFDQRAKYVIRRVFRIAPLFYFMIGFYWLQFGLPDVGLAGILLNFTFLFNFVPQLNNSLAWAGWTIGVEMPFYFCLPFLLRLDQKSVLWFVAFALATSILSRVILASFNGLPQEYPMLAFTSNLFPFAVGLFVYLYRDFRLPYVVSGRLGSALCVVSLGLLAVLIGSQLPHGARLDVLLWTPPFAWICWLQLSSPARWLGSVVMQYCGARSFSLYLVHPPIVYLLGVRGVYRSVEQALPSLSGMGTFIICELLTFGLLLPLAEMTFRFIEQPGQALGNRLVLLLSRR